MRRYVGGGLVLFAMVWMIIASVGGGDTVTEPAAAAAKAGAEVVTSSARFWTLFVLGSIILIVWALVRVLTTTGTVAARLATATPPTWAFVVLLGITTFHWLFRADSPEVWSGWLRSTAFWPMNAAILLAAYFIGRGGQPAKFAGYALAGLTIVAIGIGTSKHIEPVVEKVMRGNGGGVVSGPRTFTIEAKSGEWTEVVQFPLGQGLRVRWHATRAEARYVMRTETGREYRFTPEQSDAVPVVSEASFMALGDEPEEIRIIIYKP